MKRAIHSVVGSRVRGAIPSCTGSPSGTLCGSLHRPTAITNRGGETCSWWSGERCHPGLGGLTGAGGECGGSAARTRGGGLACERCDTLMYWKPQRHAVWQLAPPHSHHQPWRRDMLLVVGGTGERCHPGARRGLTGAGGGCGGSAARTRGGGLACERCDTLMHWKPQRHAVW